MAEKFCRRCGERCRDDVTFCRRCGLNFYALVAGEAPAPDLSPATGGPSNEARRLRTETHAGAESAPNPSASLEMNQAIDAPLTSVRASIANLVTLFSGNALLVAGAVIFVTLLLRNSGLYPTVMGDEQLYASLSRLFPFAKASVPDYAYLAIYSLTNSCGDGFLSCARILNVVAFVAALPFIYLTARRVCSRGVAILVAILALAGPINTYTAYFMPEALYFLAFWVIIWYVLAIESIFALRMWIVTGVLVGGAALVKPHALFLMPAILLYLVFLAMRHGRQGARAAVWDGLLFVVVALLTKLAGGYLLAGSAGLTILGSTYGSVGASALSDPNRAGQVISVFAESLVGHALAISLLYGLPLALSAVVAGRTLRSGAHFGAEERTSVLTFLILACLIVIVALFTALVAGIDPLDTATHLYMRYYDFAFPLLMIVVAGRLRGAQTRSRSLLDTAVAVAVGLAIIYALLSHLEPYQPILVDNPELFGVTVQPTLFMVLGCLSLGTLALWAVGSRWGVRLFVYAFLPLAVASSSIAASIELRHSLVPDQADHAGMFVKQYLPRDLLSQVLVVGSDVPELYRALFYLDDPNAGQQVIPAGSVYDLSTLPDGKDWALILGDHTWSGGSFSESPVPGFALVRRDNPIVTVDFRSGTWPGVISHVQGLSAPESEGTWSNANIVTIEFAMDLPEHFQLHITAAAFGPNAGMDFVARVGTNTAPFTLDTTLQERVLDFRNPARVGTLEIEVPLPTSPVQLGLSADTRRLGIRFATLQIVPLP